MTKGKIIIPISDDAMKVINKIDKKKQGRVNRAKGADTEKRTRKDLESKGWIVSRWQNNIEFPLIKNYDDLNKFGKEMAVRQKILLGECIAAKQGRFRMTSTGFPDFIIYRLVLHKMPEHFKLMNNYPKFEVRFIECKSNGKLSKIEKEKARWYLENNYCSKFLIASRTKIKGRIVIKYEEFKIKFRRLKKYGR